MAPMNVENVNILGGTLNDVRGDQHIYYTLENPENILETLRLASVADARYNSRNHPPPCDPNTRSAILVNIFEWIAKPGRSSVCWLSGKGGSGKSAIAQSVSEGCFANSKLSGATFFFNRQDQRRRTAEHVVATLAYQLAVSNSSLRDPICDVLRQDKDILDAVFLHQLQKLIIEPLHSLPESDYPMVIVFDGLDECDDHDQIAKYMASLVDATAALQFPLRIFITSRQEPRIRGQSSQSSTVIFRYNLQDFTADADIQTFLESRLRDIRQERSSIMHGVSPSWPSNEELDILVKKSSGLFIYASTVAKLIADEHALPHEQLKAVIDTRNGSRLLGHADLDGLYTQVMSASPNIEKSKAVIGAIVFLQTPLSPLDLGYLLGMKVDHLLLALERWHPILSIPDSPDTGPVTMFHLSLRDFLTSKERAGRFYIDPSSKHADLAKCCLIQIQTLPDSKFMNLFNPAKCRDAVSKDLRERDSTRRVSTRYACRYWSSHISESLPMRENLAMHLKDFCSKKALSWRVFLEMDALQIARENYVMTPEEGEEQKRDQEKEQQLAEDREKVILRRRQAWMLLIVVAGCLMTIVWVLKVASAPRLKDGVGVVAILRAIWDEIIWGPEDPGVAYSMWNAMLVGLLLGLVMELDLELMLAVALGMWLVLILGLGLGMVLGLGTWMAQLLAVAIAAVAVPLAWNWMGQDRPVKRRMSLMYEALMITQRRDVVSVYQPDVKRCVLRANDVMIKLPFPWRFMFYGVLTRSVTRMLEQLLWSGPRGRRQSRAKQD